MGDLIQCVDTPHQIACAARRLREVVQREEIAPEVILDIFERWAAALGSAHLSSVPGLAFLRLWLRRGTLEPLLARELGPTFLRGKWSEDGRTRLKVFPLGIIGHWPAGNIEIQPPLSMSCALLGGNACLVRVPSGLLEVTRQVMEPLGEVDEGGRLTRRISIVSFDHSRAELNEAMASAVDGAMIWGGAEAVAQLRRLGFPHWARVLVFGPRVSAAAMDAKTWGDRTARASWCRRIARDVWQFDQQACSSPQTLFLERGDGCDPAEFVQDLKAAFEQENRQHPRLKMDPSLSSAICLARASWLMREGENSALFPSAPDWTILLGEGTEMPNPIQGRTLCVMVVDDLMEVINKFDATLQTLGLGIADARREEMFAHAAGRNGVDRIVKLGRMHTFGSPWDGTELIRPMVRLVRHVQSQD
ncbi:MAG TPA: acyl-CoA reductase [Candidatus Sulfotelmatobacter sp.]|nr:acyl-CoA reductase [Candidatus Sulfotelmatobacter sp.]